MACVGTFRLNWQICWDFTFNDYFCQITHILINLNYSVLIYLH